MTTTAMTLSLTKGQNMSLSKAAPGLKKIRVALGWDPRITAGEDFDLDASAIRLTQAGKVRHDGDFVYYNQLSTVDGSVKHAGDNLTGGGDGDDETILVELDNIPTEIDTITFPVSIYDAKARKQSFGQVRNAYIRIVDDSSNQELARYDLSEDASSLDAMVFGEVYRDRANQGQWKFRAVGQGFTDGLGGIARAYGIRV